MVGETMMAGVMKLLRPLKKQLQRANHQAEVRAKVEEAMAAGSAARMDTSPGSVPTTKVEVEETAGVATVERKDTWQQSVPSQRCVAGAGRRVTRWTSVLSQPSATTVAR